MLSTGHIRPVIRNVDIPRRIHRKLTGSKVNGVAPSILRPHRAHITPAVLHVEVIRIPIKSRLLIRPGAAAIIISTPSAAPATPVHKTIHVHLHRHRGHRPTTSSQRRDHETVGAGDAFAAQSGDGAVTWDWELATGKRSGVGGIEPVPRSPGGRNGANGGKDAGVAGGSGEVVGGLAETALAQQCLRLGSARWPRIAIIVIGVQEYARFTATVGWPAGIGINSDSGGKFPESGWMWQNWLEEEQKVHWTTSLQSEMILTREIWKKMREI